MGMQAEEEWVRIRGSRSWPHEAGVSLIRFALLFGVVAVAFALILVPVLDDPARGVWSRADGPPRSMPSASPMPMAVSVRPSP